MSVLALWTIPNASSQIFFSTTTVPTSTTTILSATTSVTTYTLTSTVTTSISTASSFNIYSGTFTISSPYGTNYACYYYALHDQLYQGDVITLQIVSNTPIDFYLIGASDYNAWVNNGANCDSLPGELFAQTGIQSYSSGPLSVNADNDYYIVFINKSQYDASVTFNAAGTYGASASGTTTLEVATASSTTSTTSTTSTYFTTSTGGLLGGRCLIATATYGSELSPEVQFLRDFRDNQILETAAGSAFMIAFNAWYYSFSPSIADQISTNAAERTIMKGVLYPLIGILKFSSFTFSAASALPELAALFSGLVASSLIGAFYLGIPLTLIRVKVRRLSALTVQGLLEKLLALGVTFGVSGLFVGELFASSALMMIASVVIVLSALFFSAIFTSGRITRKLRN